MDSSEVRLPALAFCVGPNLQVKHQRHCSIPLLDVHCIYSFQSSLAAYVQADVSILPGCLAA